MFDAIVLGSSPNELVCAAYLAKGGAKVLVLERGDTIGGAAGLVEVAPGFRAAVAPAEAGWLSPKIARDLDLGGCGLETERAPSSLVTLAPEGPPIVIARDLDATCASIGARSTNDGAAFRGFAVQMSRLASFLENLYLREPPELSRPGAGELLTLAGLGLRLRAMGKVDMIDMLRVLPMSLRDLLEDTFEDDVLRGALAWTGLANLMQGPLSAGTGFTLLHHMVGRGAGAFGSRVMPSAETGHLPTVLSAALRKLGVEIRTRAAATVSVTGTTPTAVGVTLEGGEVIPAKIVVSGSDPKRALLKELAPWHLPPEVVRAVRHVKLRGVRAVMMLALDAAPTFSGLGADRVRDVLVHAPGIEMLERAYDAAKHGGLSKAPPLEITVPSMHDPSLSPAGKHVVHVNMQYAPFFLRGGFDDAARSQLEKTILDTLESLAPGITSRVVGTKLFTPADLESRFGLTEGNLYGGELTLDQILFMRPVGDVSRYETPVSRYFLCGDGTHPGGAITGMAGHHAAARALRALK